MKGISRRVLDQGRDRRWQFFQVTLATRTKGMAALEGTVNLQSPWDKDLEETILFCLIMKKVMEKCEELNNIKVR